MTSEPRLYLYRKAGREVWDAEMWLPDGCRRVWRTGISNKDAAMAAARARLEALATVQTVAPPLGERLEDGSAPAMSPGASAGDGTPSLAQAEAPASAAMGAQPSAGDRPTLARADTDAGAALASETQAQGLQMPARAQAAGALARFDRWFFSDLWRLFSRAAS